MPDVNVPRVLVADDQSDVVLALRLLLRDAGLDTDSAASVPEIRSRLNDTSYDLLLTDLNYARDTTSGREGLELLAEVHARDPLLPVVVMTGWGSIETAVEAMRRGARGFIHKPWDNAALADAIRREVDDGRATRSAGRRVAREQEEAQAIQRALLPSAMPAVAGCDPRRSSIESSPRSPASLVDPDNSRTMPPCSWRHSASGRAVSPFVRWRTRPSHERTTRRVHQTPVDNNSRKS